MAPTSQSMRIVVRSDSKLCSSGEAGVDVTLCEASGASGRVQQYGIRHSVTADDRVAD
jgi:hypothetical protein